jgi:hypothetical protein
VRREGGHLVTFFSHMFLIEPCHFTLFDKTTLQQRKNDTVTFDSPVGSRGARVSHRFMSIDVTAIIP